MRDEVFEKTDNMFVFLLQPTELLDRKDEIQNVLRTFARQESLHRVRYFYKVREDGGDFNGTAATFARSSALSTPTLRVVLYKGRRRLMVDIRTNALTKHVEEI